MLQSDHRSVADTDDPPDDAASARTPCSVTNSSHSQGDALCVHGAAPPACDFCTLDSRLLATTSASHDSTARLTPTTSPNMNRAPTPSAASALPIVSLFRHNAAAFSCTLCQFSASQLADLRAHRRSKHRHESFSDYFHAACGCTATFPARSAATLHAHECRGEQCGRRDPADIAVIAGDAARGAVTSSLTPPPADPTASVMTVAAIVSPVSPPPRSSCARGKRRRLNPDDDCEDASPTLLKLADRPVPAPAAVVARRRLATRWGACLHRVDISSVPTDVIPDTPTDGWVDVSSLAKPSSLAHPYARPEMPTCPPDERPPRTRTRWGPRRASVSRRTDRQYQDLIQEVDSHPPTSTAPMEHVERPTDQTAELATSSSPSKRATAPPTTQNLPAPITWRDLASVFDSAPPSDMEPAHCVARSPVLAPLTIHHSDAAEALTETTPHDDSDSTSAMMVDFDASTTAEMTLPTRSSPSRRRDRRQRHLIDRAIPSPIEAVATNTDDEWLLQFDGACKGNPAPGGAGAALFAPDGTIAWCCYHYLADAATTNNVAEYSGLLIGISGALHHGVKRLRIEGDSTLVVEQVKGRYACRSKTLQRLRRDVRSCLGRFDTYSIRQVDRTLNKVADGLANDALRRRRTSSTCKQHAAGCSRQECWTPALSDGTVTAPEVSPVPMRTSVPDVPPEDAAELARRDGGQVFRGVDLSSGAVPARRPVLRLRALGENEKEAAATAVEKIAASFTAKISTAETWAIGEGYLTAMTHQLYETLLPFSDCPERRRPTVSDPAPRRHGAFYTRPTSSQTRLDEAVACLQAAQRRKPNDRATIKKARRKVGRIRTAIRRQYLRSFFRVKEKACVAEILRASDEMNATTSSSAMPSSGPVPQPPPPVPTLSTTKCPIDAATLEEYFTGVNTERSAFEAGAPIGRAFREVLEELEPAQEAGESFDQQITLEEVEEQLHHVSALSAPGLDGVGYVVFKQFNVELLPLLLAAFRFCWQHQRVPRSWKIGAVKLLYKKGDPTRPGNWRPICLQEAVYKLYAGILARRFTHWMERNNRHTNAQKGFRTFNGCADHNYVAAAMSDQARRHHRSMYIVWYDLQNAFGSVPHTLMWYVLEKLGVAPSFVQRCRDIYTDAAFMVSNSKDGMTAPIHQRVGVFQGCPLSPHLFTATLIPLLRALEKQKDVGIKMSGEDTPSVTAYADDLKIFSSTREAITRQHDLMQRFLKWSGMRANAGKCSSMGVAPDGHGILQQDNLRLSIHGDAIPSISMSESYQYLGIGDGVNHEQRRLEMNSLLATVKRHATALFTSGLSPWQILKAYKIYLLPRLEYALRFLRPLDSQLEGLDDHVKRGFRHLLKLPKQATNEILYSPTSCGGLGLLPLREMHAAIQLAHGWQLLHSADPTVQRIARAQLGQVVRKRHNVDEHHWKDKTELLLAKFLNGKLSGHPFAPAKRHHADIESLWSDMQRHVRTFHVAFEDKTVAESPSLSTPRGQVASPGPLNLRVPHFKEWLSGKTVLRHLKLYLKLQHRDRWQAMKTQGRTVTVHGGRGSTLVTNPKGHWDADYTFAMRARLDVVDTNSALKRWRLRAHPICRYPTCSHVETLPHVLQHCLGTTDVIRQRHDDVLKVITRELESKVKESNGRLQLRVNQTVPGYTGRPLRPDIQVYDKDARTAAIVDLAIPFDARDGGDGSGLTWIHDEKLRKYKPIERQLSDRGWHVKSAAIVYGALGSVASSNEKAYTETLGLQKRTGKYLDRTLSAKAVQGSRRIWKWHAAQHVRNQRTRRRSAGTGGDPSPRHRPRQH